MTKIIIELLSIYFKNMFIMTLRIYFFGKPFILTLNTKAKKIKK